LGDFWCCFIRQFSGGHGDCTQELDALHEGKTGEGVMGEIRRGRE
jgi:hypothetical protein